MFEKGKRVPNLAVKDHTGAAHDLWDFRQKSHVVLLNDPNAEKETIQRWTTALQADRKQWDWLNVRWLIVKKAPKDLLPGVYAIDRFGMFINVYPPDHWSFDDLEREYLYYEAHHC